jgi:carbon storage regulator
VLILTRKKGESIKINDNIEISIVEIKGDTVKLGIEAPKSVKVFRREVYDAIQKENEAALNSIVTSLPSGIFNKE